MTLKTKIIIVIIMAFTSWTTVSAQYETDVPPDMMNMEYAEKADSMGKAILVNKGSYATAIELFKRSSTIYKHFNGETDESYLTAMALLAKCYMRNDQIQDAISVTCILCGIYEKNGLDREQYAVIKDNLSVYYALADEGEKALEASKIALSEYEKTGKMDFDYASILIHAAEVEARLENFPEAIRYQLRALDIIHQLKGVGSETYINELKYLQQYYEEAGDAAKMQKTQETIEALEKPGGGVRQAEELQSTEACTYHRGDAYWCAEYYLTHKLSASNAWEAGQYAMAWCISTDELSLEIDDRHIKCIGDCPTELTAYFCACLMIGQANEVSKLTREMERMAMRLVVRHYSFNEDIIIKKSPEVDKLLEYYKNDTLDEKLLELIPDVADNEATPENTGE